jgi:hypothetical protein
MSSKETSYHCMYKYVLLNINNNNHIPYTELNLIDLLARHLSQIDRTYLQNHHRCKMLNDDSQGYHSQPTVHHKDNIQVKMHLPNQTYSTKNDGYSRKI